MLDEMTPEERRDLIALAELRVAQDTPFDAKWLRAFQEPNGDRPFKDCTNWAEFAEARDRMEERILRGSGQDTRGGDSNEYWMRQTPRNALPGATELEVPAPLEGDMELLLLGASVVDGPVHPALSFLYPHVRATQAEVGVYARPEEVNKRFRGRLGLGKGKGKGEAPGAEVVGDLVKAAADVELTLMASALQDLSMAELRERARPLLLEAVKRHRGSAADVRTAEAFLRQFDPALIQAEWVDAKGTIAKGTKIILSTLPDGRLSTEVMSQGRLVDKTMTDFGEVPSKAVSRAVFDAAMQAYRGLDRATGSGVANIANVGAGREAAQKAVTQVVQESIDRGVAAVEQAEREVAARRKEAEEQEAAAPAAPPKKPRAKKAAPAPKPAAEGGAKEARPAAEGKPKSKKRSPSKEPKSSSKAAPEAAAEPARVSTKRKVKRAETAKEAP